MIKAENLKKSFGPKLAVNGISFSVERGEILGFLGPNGAGKSTTMRMLTGFIAPDEGVITVAGRDIAAHPIQAKRMIGYLPESAPAYDDMTVNGFLGFAAELRGLSGAAKKQAVSNAVEKCFLESVIHQSVDTLSKGFRHRTCLAQALLHDPDILILDEPTDGLDPNQKHEVRGLIRNMGANKAIIFSTHILEEVEAACTRAIIIDRGRIVANGTPQQLKARSSHAGAVVVTIGAGRRADHGADRGADLARKLSALPAARAVEVVYDDASKTVLRVLPSSETGALAGAIAEWCAREACKLEGLTTEEGRLDEVFRAITLPDTGRAGAAANSGGDVSASPSSRASNQSSVDGAAE